MSDNESSQVIWKNIKGFNKYEISNTAVVRNKITLYELKPTYDGKYWRTNLCKDIKNENGIYKQQNKSLHRLIADAFIENLDENKKYIDHIDGSKNNHDITNLRWCTASENKQYSHDMKGSKVVLQLNLSGQLIKRWNSAREVKESNPTYSVHHISSVILGRRKTHRGYKWAYETKTEKKKARDLYTDEIFKKIGTFDGHDYSEYSVSNYGMIKNSRDMILKPFDDRGYEAYRLYDGNNGKSNQMMAHRLVAFKFCSGRTKNRNVVNHIDEKRKNNHYKNLDWVSYYENSLHSTSLFVKQIDIKSDEIIETFASMTLAADKFNGSPGVISECCSGKKKTAYGFKWKIID